MFLYHKNQAVSKPFRQIQRDTQIAFFLAYSIIFNATTVFYIMLYIIFYDSNTL